MMQKTAPSAAVKPSAPKLPKKKFKLTFSVGALNTLLFLGIIACIAALVIEMRSGFSLINQAVEFPPDSRTEQTVSDIALPSTHSADYYLRQVNERNIFRPYVPKVAKKAAVQGLVQLMSRYKLVGIAWLDLPETASIMIEDTRKNETYFLKQGEQLEGVTVKTIYTDRAVFSHENEEMTIKL
jgi:hypothetical protein